MTVEKYCICYSSRKKEFKNTQSNLVDSRKVLHFVIVFKKYS